jgi:signal transduction histidine kinase/ligand-binding sensor domain-containing protein/CheY-like chemotaxis protein
MFLKRPKSVFIAQLFFTLTVMAGNNYNLKQLSIEQKLPGVSVQGIMQDHFGIMWFGIESVGLCKFDGQEFTVFENHPNDSTTISNNFAKSIFEDSQGTIWVGTTGGLNKFDRETGKFTRYLKAEGNVQSIPDNFIHTIMEDKFGYLWLGTENGFCKFNPRTQEFVNLQVNRQSIGTKLVVAAIDEDHEGNIWIGTWQKGLMKISARTNLQHSREWDNKPVSSLVTELTIDGHFLYNASPNNQTVYEDVRCVTHDPYGNIYIGTTAGMHIYNLHIAKMERWDFAKYGAPELNKAIFSKITIDRNNILWIGTTSYGLGIFNLNTKELHYLNADDDPLMGLKSNSIRDILEDHSGLVWIATKFQGLQIYDPRQNTFGHIREAGKNKGLSDDFVISVHEMPDKNIWIGTKEGGVNIYNPISGDITVLKHEPGNPQSLKSNRIEHIFVDSAQNIWLGTENSLELYDKRTGKFKHYGNYHVKKIFAKSATEFWIGTNMEGLFIFNSETKQFRRHSSKTSGLFEDQNYIITGIIKDSNYLWVGTGSDGLFRYDESSDQLKHFVHLPSDPHSISGNMVRSIFQDTKGHIWIGTKSDGLNKYLPDRDHFIQYSENEGMPSNTIYSIMEDRAGNFWMGTHNGIAKYNVEEHEFENFNESYGLQGKIFEINAFCNASNGIMYLGGSNGINIFDPLNTYKKKYIAPVIISSVKVYDKVIAQDITTFKSFELDYDDKFISFNYAILDYSEPINNSYAYMLENFDQDWIYSGNRHYASYTSLPPGEYVFKVKGANVDNDWNEEGVSIQMVIKAPFWKKAWFVALLALLAGCFVYLLYLYRLRMVRRHEKYLMEVVKQKTGDLQKANYTLEQQKTEIEKHNRILIEQSKKITLQNEELEQHRNQLEKLVSERTIDLEKAKIKAEESDLLKSAFLANMSHEIRTPLNAIVGFSDLLAAEDYTKVEMQRINKVIKNNSQSLLQIINDIVDISKIEANQLVINKKEFNLNRLMRELHNRYQAQLLLYCKEKNLEIEIELDIDARLDHIMLVNDAFRIEQIFTNLFSNAVKFTRSGLIRMGYTHSGNNDAITFFISDTGIGISPENKEVIFDRFRKIEDDKSHLYRGTGLGLSISLNLAKMMGGKIWVESELGMGSCFYIELPFEEGSHKQPESSGPLPIMPIIPDWSSKNMLLVEDEESNIDVLRTILRKTGIKISVARDGIEAVEMSTKSPKPFDLILMDIKLPKLNGIEATRKIKAFNRQIPIIAQTAYAMHDEEREIMKVGFNDYISKPILANVLYKKMEDLLNAG